ncbi:MAG: alpha/beta fold hydrolase [Gemmatimonadetes bacterium]|nr:alpha/beta fold hydrolase [Gemmatimonadota bacterium]
MTSTSAIERTGIVRAWLEQEARENVAAAQRSFARGGPEDSACPILFLHGGGGGPADFHPLARALGPPVFCPLLPAHGRGEDALAALTFDSLVVRAREAYDVLATSGRPPLVVAQSLGAIVAVRLLADRPAAGLVALAPALRPRTARRAAGVLRTLLVSPRRAFGSYRWQTEARRAIRATPPRLADVRCPLLVLVSTDDPTVSPAGARAFHDLAGASDKELVVLEGQGHVLSAAPDLESVAAPIRAFRARIGARAAAS